MPHDLTRRRFLRTTAALAAAPLVPAMTAATLAVADKAVPLTISQLCLWSDRYKVANEMLGRVHIKGHLYASSQPPEHPVCPGLYASEVTIKNEGEWGGIHYAMVTVTYSPPEFIPGMGA